MRRAIREIDVNNFNLFINDRNTLSNICGNRCKRLVPDVVMQAIGERVVMKYIDRVSNIICFIYNIYFSAYNT